MTVAFREHPVMAGYAFANPPCALQSALRHSRLYPLILRSIAKRCVSKDAGPENGATWFETALTRLLTMRIK